MVWRTKTEDLKLLEHFKQVLREFHRLKEERWENIEDQVQMDINPGTPSEDWIIPPDEEQTSKILQKDPDYRRLRNEILKYVDQTQEINHFLGANTHHALDWINFNDPLIGNSALEDGTEAIDSLIKTCQNNSYFLKNTKQFFNCALRK